MNFFKKTIEVFKKTKSNIQKTFSNVLSFSDLNEQDVLNIEECLLSTDIGFELTELIITKIKKNNKKYDKWEDLLIDAIKCSINNIDTKTNKFKKVILIIGVNGSGKTTSSAKLAQYYKNEHKKITLVAADTYRAAAVEQLKIWSDRLNVDFISNSNTTDSASVAFDGVNSGISRNHNHIIVDTAGRLHTSKNLMLELEKVYRIISKLTDDISVCIAIDSNVGQNGIKQVEEFNNYLPIDSIILNKMDGTARGGVALAILHKLSIPISFIGTGESYEDLVEFDLDQYLESLIKK